MSRTLVFIFLFTSSAPLFAVQPSGVIQQVSPHSVKQTTERLTALLLKKGFTIFLEIDHSDNAKTHNINLTESKLIVFGNPKIGSQLMKCSPSIGLDLPQKALIHKSGDKTLLTFNHPSFLQQRHAAKKCQQLFKKITKVIKTIAKESIQ